MSEWTPQETTFLVNQRAKGVKARAIARELGKSYNAVTCKTKSLITSGQLEAMSRTDQKYLINKVEKFVPEVQPSYDKFFKFNADVLVISDVHIPYHHAEMIELMLKVALKYKIKTLVIAGDFLNGDAFSRFATGFRGEKCSEEEFNVADYVLTKFLKVFERIVWTTGNHEDRFYKSFGGNIPHVRFLRMLHDEVSPNWHDKKRIKVSNYPYCLVNDSWAIGHPQNFGSSGGTVPARIADKLEKNVICGHNHQFGIQFSLSGNYMGIDHGCACDPVKIEYNMKGFNTYRTWQNGFTMIKDNYPYVFNLKTTDWDWWLK